VLIYISASFEPAIYDFPTDLEVCEGEYVILYVTVTGQPPPLFTWYHNNESVSTNSSIEVSGDGTLSIPSMEEKHVGTYRLVASNSYGSCFEEMELTIECEDTFTLRRAESIASMIDNAPVPVSSFEEYVALQHRKNNEAFHFQFLVRSSPHELVLTELLYVGRGGGGCTNQRGQGLSVMLLKIDHCFSSDQLITGGRKWGPLPLFRS
jgi:hypothetical protein